MKPAYTIIRHVDSNRSRHSQRAFAAHQKGLNYFSHQCVREFPREVELKRQARAKKKLNATKA